MTNNCEYGPVQNNNSVDHSDGDYERSWIPFLRQVLVSTGVWSMYFQSGMALGTPTVVIPRMREQRGEEYVSQEMASWMSSAIGYASVLCIPILAMLTSYIGRRRTFALSTVSTLIAYSLLYAGDTPELVLASMIVQGLGTAPLVTICILILTEYTSPVYRGMFLTAKSATFFWGLWVANAIGTVAHWRYIAALGLACGIYNVVTLLLWPESPFWLASKGRLDECREAHRWLKGHSTHSENELQELIKSQQHPEVDYLEERQKKTGNMNWKEVCDDIKTKYFYKSLLISMALYAQYHFSGKLVYNIYAIDIIKDITKSKSTAFKGMLILDGLTVLGMYIGSGLSKKLTRRMQLLSSGGVSVIFLLTLSLYLYLIKFELILRNKFITMFLLTGFSLAVSCGPMILSSTLAAELLSLHSRGACTAFAGMTAHILMGTTLKVAPWIFTTFGMPGAFLFYGLTSGIFLLLLYMYLPETKDKTMQDIEELILNIGSKSNRETTDEQKQQKF